MAWLSGFIYRKSITLSRASGAVTDYQMKLLVGESAGATGEDVDCNSHIQTDFDDLRFTTSDGQTLLDYWIESLTGTTPNQLATVWVEFDSIGTGATTFYMYYGRADAPAVSNRPNTFGKLFNDFASDTIGNDPVGFTDLDSVWAVRDDSGNVIKNSGDGTIQWDIPSSVTNGILRFKMKYISGANNRWQVRLRQVDTSNAIYVGCIYSNNFIDIYEGITGTYYRRAYASFTYGTGWHDVEIALRDGSIVVRIDTTEIHYDSLNFSSGAVINFNANSGAIVEYDDICFVSADNALDTIVDDNFNDNSLGAQWTINYGSVTGTLFEEVGAELKYSGTPSATGYVSITTPYTSKRYGWLQTIKFKTPTGALGVNKEILFRMEADSINFIEISCQADGYRVEKVENNGQPSGSVVGPVALFGNEATVFHTLKLLWDEFDKKVYGWVDNTYIGRLVATTTTFPDQQRFILHLNNTISSAIDRRFDDFVIRSWRDGEPAWGSWGGEEESIRNLLASIVGSSITPTISATMVRSLLTGISATSLTPDVAATITRSLLSVISATSITSDALATLSRSLLANIQGSTSTSDISSIISRSLLASIAGASTTPDITATMAEVISLIATIAGTSATPDITATNLRALLANIQTVSSTPNISITIARSLLASISGISLTPDVSIAIARALMANIAVASLTPSIIALETRALLAGIVTGSVTSDVAATIARSLLASMVGTSITSDISSVSARAILAAIAGSSSTPDISSTSARALLAAISGQTLTPDVAANIVRSLLSTLTVTSLTPSVLSILSRSLLANIQGSTSTSDISSTSSRTILSSIAGSSLTPEISAKIVRELIGLIEAQSTTSNAVISITRNLLANISVLSMTSDINVGFLLSLLAVIAGLSLTPEVSLTIIRNILTNIVAESYTPNIMATQTHEYTSEFNYELLEETTFPAPDGVYPFKPEMLN